MQFHSGGALPALSTQEKFEKFKVPEKKGVATACNAQDTGMFLWPYKGKNKDKDKYKDKDKDKDKVPEKKEWQLHLLAKKETKTKSL